MKLFIIASMIAMNAAGRLDRMYLPPGIGGPLLQPGGGSLSRPGDGPLIQPGGGPFIQPFLQPGGGSLLQPGGGSLVRPGGGPLLLPGGGSFLQPGGGSLSRPGGGPFLQSGPVLRPGGGPVSGPLRPGPSGEAAAQIVKMDSDVTATGFQYSFETQNGISAQASAEDQGDGLRSQGTFTYPGPDGQTYTVTYTADENGFQPQGAHLPTAPPIPEEILKSLEQNAKDEAAGIIDDGSYDAAKYGEAQSVGMTGSRQTFQTIQTNQIQSGIRRPQSFSPQTGYQY